MLGLAPDRIPICTDTGDLKLKKHLQSTVSSRQTEREIACYIIDGSEILYVVH